MESLTQKVLEIIENSNGIKAKDIAEQLGVDRVEINSVLYSANGLKNKCWQDSNYFWYSNTKNKATKFEKNINADKKLNAICRYYLNCISVEGVTGISTFLTSKFDLPYIEVSSIEKSELYNNQAVSEYLLKNNRLKKSANYLGYPVLVDVRKSKKGEVYYKEIPVFIFNLNYDGGKIEIDSIPNINIDVVKKYSTNDSHEIIYDQLKLEEELGLTSDSSDEIFIDELVSRLQNSRGWEWKEKLDPSNINLSIPLKNITEPGIYNKAVIVSTERSPYTLGLESELLALSKLSSDDYFGTALYNWINGINTVKEAEGKNVLEVLPLNTEQREAVERSLTQDTTIVTGPPGTGKSQVVTDILINMAYNHQSVLFSSKNNKAVSVVDNRVNGLAKKPVMLRLGGNSCIGDFAKVLSDLLSSHAYVQEPSNYEYYETKYKEFATRKTQMLLKKKDIIALRNKVDRLEKDITTFEELREKIPQITDDLVNKILCSNIEYKMALKYADKSKQNFFVKLFWNLSKNARENNLISHAEKLNYILNEFNVKVSSKVNHLTQNDEEMLVAELIRKLKIIVEYKNSLQKLNNCETLENIDKKVTEIDAASEELAIKLWREWLNAKDENISSSTRSQMMSFVSEIRLVGDTELNNNPEIKNQFKKLQSQMMNYLPCWSVTSLSIKGRIPFIKGMFDLLIIDEASQCDIASILPLLFRAKRAVIIGDPMQLKHISALPNKQDYSMLKKYGVDATWSYSLNSLYDLASSLVDSRQIIHLRDHHRSFGDIIEFSNEEFYNGKLRIATNYSNLKKSTQYESGVRWIDVKGETIRPNAGSAYNVQEIDAIVEELRRIANSDYAGSVGVVTPFALQATKIREQVEKDSELLAKLNKLGTVNDELIIDTVHRFQGDEKDIMIFSPTISNGAQSGTINFLNNTGNLFNVAITRARSILIVIGDKQYCSECNVTYMNDFVRYYDRLQIKEQKIDLINYGKTREYPNVSNEDQVSEWEKIFYTKLFDAGIQTIPQYAEDKYKLDLAIVIGDRKLDIEVDGEMYHKDWNGELCYRDQLRNQRLFELGWDVKRFWVYQIRDELDWCIDKIKEWISKGT